MDRGGNGLGEFPIPGRTHAGASRRSDGPDEKQLPVPVERGSQDDDDDARTLSRAELERSASFSDACHAVQQVGGGSQRGDVEIPAPSRRK